MFLSIKVYVKINFFVYFLKNDFKYYIFYCLNNLLFLLLFVSHFTKN